MTTDRDAIRRFFRTYAAAPVGADPAAAGRRRTTGRGPARRDRPHRRADRDRLGAGHRARAAGRADGRVPAAVHRRVARRAAGAVRAVAAGVPDPAACWPRSGRSALRLVGRRFEREFVAVERVLGFVADPFPWEEVEAFAADLLNKPELRLRVLPANRPA